MIWTSDLYKEYQRTDHWKEIRRKRLEIDKHACGMCGTSENECGHLEMHHISYERLLEEDIQNDLIMLCPECHRLATA